MVTSVPCNMVEYSLGIGNSCSDYGRATVVRALLGFEQAIQLNYSVSSSANCYKLLAGSFFLECLVPLYAVVKV